MKEELVHEKVLPAKYKKTSITGKIVASKVEEEDDVSPPKKLKSTKSAKKSGGGKSAKKSAAQSDEDEEEEHKPVMKSIVRKGKYRDHLELLLLKLISEKCIYRYFFFK